MRPSRFRFQLLALAGACLLTFRQGAAAQEATVPPRVTEAVDVEKLVTLPGNTHPLARPEFDQGAAPDALPIRRMLLVLQRSPEQETELRRLLDEQQTNSSPNFHQWLTPEEYGRRFGPADQDIQAVTGWLSGEGFEVSRVAAGRTVIEFSGTAGQVRQAFHTEIHKFVLNGEEHWANASDPQIPAALAPVVTGIASLNSFPRQPLHHVLGAFQRSKTTGEVKPLFTFSVYGTSYYGLGPTDFATIYNVLPLWNAGIDGRGQSIAIVAPSNINPQDVTDFRSLFGLPANAPKIIVDGPDPGLIPGYETEADLDVEWAGAVAKNATIDLVVSQSTESSAGVDLAALYIIDNDLAPVMSVSYGLCEDLLGTGGNAFYNALWEQAAAQGITVMVASGDSGSAGCDPYTYYQTAAAKGLAVSGLASTPFNVAVGGTDFNDIGSQSTYWNSTNNSTTGLSAKSYIPEVPWNTTCARSGSLAGCASVNSNGLDLVAGGGGQSPLYSKPSWQTGPGVQQDGHRDIPDVSLFASMGVVTSNGQVAAGSMSFYIICARDLNNQQGGNTNSCDLNAPYLNFIGVGGTSASSPAFAGIMALVNQKTNQRQGNANYVLYKLAAQSGASCTSNTSAISKTSCIFYDETTSNMSVACQRGTPNCSNPATGYGVLVEPNSATTPAWPAAAGYDMATGLGSVNATNLVNKWTSASFTPSTTTLAVSTTPATDPITLVHGQPVNVSIQVTPQSGTGTPTGDVSLIAQVSNSGGNSSTTAAGGPFTLSGGTASGTTTFLPGGSYDVFAHYAGDGAYGGSDSTPGIPVTVGKENSLTTLRLVTWNLTTGVPSYGATTAAYGSPYVLRLDVTNSSGKLCAPSEYPDTGLPSYPCPTGQVTVTPAPTDQNPPPGTVPGVYALNSEGIAEDWPIQQVPGVYNFVANYAGDSSYNPSTTTVPITITQAPTTVAITGLPSTLILYGATFPLDATVSTQSNGVAPTGTVQFFSGGNPVGPAHAILGFPYSAANGTYAGGVVQDYILTLAPGAHTLTVEYSGDSIYAPSTSVPVTVQVEDFQISADPAALTIAVPGQSATSTITITPLGGFTGTTNLSCTVLAPYTGLTCSLSPASANITGSAPVPFTLTVKSTANSSAWQRITQPKGPHGLPLPTGWLWLLAGFLAMSALLCSAAANRRPLSWLVASALLVVAAWAACGGGGSAPPPPPGPAVTLSTTSLNFGQVPLGSGSAPQTVTLTNSGNATLTLGQVAAVTGDYPDFPYLDNTCFGATVPPGGTCLVKLAFVPQATGSRTSTLDFNDNAPGGRQSVSLSGTGVQPPTPPGTYDLSVFASTSNNTILREIRLTVTVQ